MHRWANRRGSRARPMAEECALADGMPNAFWAPLLRRPQGERRAQSPHPRWATATATTVGADQDMFRRASSNNALFVQIPGSRDQVIHDFAVNVGQTKIAAGVAECQLGVIKAQQVKNRGMQIMHVNFVLDRP